MAISIKPLGALSIPPPAPPLRSLSEFETFRVTVMLSIIALPPFQIAPPLACARLPSKVEFEISRMSAEELIAPPFSCARLSLKVEPEIVASPSSMWIAPPRSTVRFLVNVERSTTSSVAAYITPPWLAIARLPRKRLRLITVRTPVALIAPDSSRAVLPMSLLRSTVRTPSCG